MEKEDVFKRAIKERKPVTFEYRREDKVQGVRIGNPHVLFTHPSTNKLEVHVFQTGGVSNSNLNDGLPWRLFILDFIESPKILDISESFNPAEGYNPDSPMYANFIAKV